MTSEVSDSRFYMWRTLFAMTHVDHNVSKEEVRFMAEALEDIPFSEEQRQILLLDTVEVRDVVEMFKGISDVKDQAQFFQFARNLVWVDGDYGAAEQDILLKLQKLHLKSVNVDELVDKVTLEFAEEKDFNKKGDPEAGPFTGGNVPWGVTHSPTQKPRKKGLQSVLNSFIEQFGPETDE